MGKITLPTFGLVAPFMKFELFKRQPETLFLMANGVLSLDEFFLLQFDPLLIKSEAFLDLEHATMEVL